MANANRPSVAFVQSRLLVVQQADAASPTCSARRMSCNLSHSAPTAAAAKCSCHKSTIRMALLIFLLILSSMLPLSAPVTATRYPIKINQGTQRVSSSSSYSTNSHGSASSRPGINGRETASSLVIQSTEFAEEAKSLPISLRNQSPLGYSSSLAITAFYPQKEFLDLTWHVRPPVPFHAPPPPPSRAKLIDKLGLASYRGNGTIGMTLAALMAKTEPVDEEAWADLVGKCARVVASKYVYTLCPFHNMTQSFLAPRSKRGSEVQQPLIAPQAPVFHLGTFSGWAYDGEREELAMHYTLGNLCTARDGTHRRRQTKIHLRCLKHRPAGESNLAAAEIGNSTTNGAPQSDLLAPNEFFLRHVLEGERCRYSARLYTPLICGVGYKTSKKLKKLVREKRVKQARSAHEKLVKRLSNPSTRTTAISPSSHKSSSHNSTVDYTLLLRGGHGGGSVHQRLQFHMAFSEMKQCLASIMKQMSLQHSVVAVRGSGDDTYEATSRPDSKLLRRQRLKGSTQAFAALTARAFQPTVDKLCLNHMDRSGATHVSALP